jgi:hypothetical protein
LYFWVKRDRSPYARLVRGSVSVPVPDDRQREVLTADCEDWLLDTIWEGVLAEWNGTKLIFHFATIADAAAFTLVWT